MVGVRERAGIGLHPIRLGKTKVHRATMVGVREGAGVGLHPVRLGQTKLHQV